ncbi:hypothetical protein NHX12_018323 [Muraenolepis orangiensis]|uniref:Ig-like domain-containing protein n=1 Tax=Muraenolepis orangiensis TaxID=630683 RepID=A0A9Q0EY13_9TELE|nr:hypothetical protein NHX12_018323 [Muraenolepis orangiensis]
MIWKAKESKGNIDKSGYCLAKTGRQQEAASKGNCLAKTARQQEAAYKGYGLAKTARQQEAASKGYGLAKTARQLEAASKGHCLAKTARQQEAASKGNCLAKTARWHLSGTLVRTSSGRRVSVRQGSLTIGQMWSGDIGDYTCTVTSLVGNNSPSARLEVIELPHSPHSLVVQLNDSDSRSMHLSWLRPFDGNSLLLHYLLELSENSKCVCPSVCVCGKKRRGEWLWNVGEWFSMSPLEF